MKLSFCFSLALRSQRRPGDTSNSRFALVNEKRSPPRDWPSSEGLVPLASLPAPEVSSIWAVDCKDAWDLRPFDYTLPAAITIRFAENALADGPPTAAR